MLFQDIRLFYRWLSNRNSQLRIDFIGLVYMVPIGAHSVSTTMKITTTCSLNAPIQQYGGMFVTDATLQELQKAGMNGFDGPLSLGMAKVSSIFLVNWVSQLQCIISGKNGMQGMSRTSNLVFDQIECIIRDKLDLMRNVLPTDENIRIQSLVRSQYFVWW